MESIKTQFISQLKRELQQELPGIKSHQRMLPPGRELIPPFGNDAVVQSGVILLLFPEGDGFGTVVIQRPTTMKNHAGQIALPGGKMEKHDRTIIATALRETEEEIGIAASEIRILGQLSPVYVQVSNFIIHPVVAYYEGHPAINIDPSEVADFYKIDLNDLLTPDNLVVHNVETLYGLLAVPGYSINGLFIWGATAMILSEFLEVYRQVNRGK